jgi:hypothetical protein
MRENFQASSSVNLKTRTCAKQVTGGRECYWRVEGPGRGLGGRKRVSVTVTFELERDLQSQWGGQSVCRRVRPARGEALCSSIQENNFNNYLKLHMSILKTPQLYFV